MQTKRSGVPRQEAEHRRRFESPGGLWILCVAIASVAVYLPALWNGFVWDDQALVLRDPFIRSWCLAAEGARHFLFADATASAFFRPVQRLTYTADYAVWGLVPAGYHLTNIAVHAGAAIGLLFFAAAWLGRRAAAGFAALAWAVLPVHSSAVAYVAGRADPLVALFGFWGLFAAVRGRWPVAAGLMLLAALSKEHGLLFCALLPIFGAVSGRARRSDRAVWGGLGLCVALAVMLLRVDAAGPLPPEPGRTDPATRPIVAARAVAEYAGLLVAPANLRMERDVVVAMRPGDDPGRVFGRQRLRELQGVVGVLLVLGLAAWIARARPVVRACLAAVSLLYLPVSGLFPLNANVAEHWVYLPSAFLLVALFFEMRAPWVLVPWIVYSGALTIVRCGDWRDQRLFLERTVAAGGDSARMLLNLGNVAFRDGDFSGALACYTKARERASDLAFIGLAEGSTYLRLGDREAAKAAFLRAGRDPFLRPEAFVGLAAVFEKGGEVDPLVLLETASRISGRAWAVEKRRLRLLAERGELGRAISELRELLRSAWWRGESWVLLGELARWEGDEELAGKADAMGRRLDPRAGK
jgi:hypothetical protein